MCVVRSVLLNWQRICIIFLILFIFNLKIVQCVQQLYDKGENNGKEKLKQKTSQAQDKLFQEYLMTEAHDFTKKIVRKFQKKYIEEKKQANANINSQIMIWIAPQNQLQQYQQNLNKLKNLLQSSYQEKNYIFKGDPQKNVNFLLDSQTLNMSFFYEVQIKNNKKSFLVLQISTINIDELAKKKPITIYVIKHKGKRIEDFKQQQKNNDPQSQSQSDQQNEIKMFKVVNTHQIITLQLQLDKEHIYWYQIFISLASQMQMQIQSSSSSRQSQKNLNEKHVSLLVEFINIKKQNSFQKTQKNQKGLDVNRKNIVQPSMEQSSQILKLLKDVSFKNDKIFLQSLQFWQTVKRHRQQHEQNVKFTYFTAALQIFSIAVVFLLEFTVLKKMIKRKVII